MDDAELSPPRRRARRRRPRRRFAGSSTTNGPTPRPSPRSARFPRDEIRAALRRPARAAGDRGAQPAHLRLRPDHHLRTGLPARGRRLLGRQQVFLPRHRRRRRHQFHALAGRAHHELRDHRQRLHAGARGHRPRRVDGDGADRVLRAGRHQGRPRRPLLRLGARSLGARVGAVGQAPHRLARQAGAPGALGDAADVRRHLDGGQGHVQDRAGRRGRRRSDHLRAAHQRSELHARPPDRGSGLPLPRLFRRPARALRRLRGRRARALDAREGPGHLRRCDGHRDARA